MKCEYRNCEVIIESDSKVGSPKRYCCKAHKNTEASYRARDNKPKNNVGKVGRPAAKYVRWSDLPDA